MATLLAPLARAWEEHALPRLVELACGSSSHDALREQACAGLSGTVLELGSGSGLNLPHLPPQVTRVLAVEPSDTAWRRSAARRRDAAARGVEVVRAGLDGQRLDLPDASVDAALSTWVLCTVPDAVAALREVRRVLHPGGRLHLVEHGLAPDPGVEAWQRRLEPVQRRVAGGCHLTRDVPALLAAAGLHLEELETGYQPGAPRPLAHLFRGRASAGQR